MNVIIPFFAVYGVVTVAAIYRICAVTFTTVNGVIARTAIYDVAFVTAINRVVTRTTVDIVGAFTALYVLIIAVPVESVVMLAAVDVFVSAVLFTGSGWHRASPIPGRRRVCAFTVTLAAANELDVVECIDLSIACCLGFKFDHKCIAGAKIT